MAQTFNASKAAVDPLEQRVSVLLRGLLLALTATTLLSIPVPFFTPLPLQTQFMLVASTGATVAFELLALVILKRGNLRVAATLTASGLVVMATLLLIGTGLARGGLVMLIFALPVVLAGLLLQRPGLIAITAASIMGALVVFGLELAGVPLIGFAAPSDTTIFGPLAGFVLVLASIAFCAGRFGGELRRALHEALLRQQQMEELSSSLEQRVAERTADLQVALEALESHSDRQAQLLTEIASQRQVINELSIPALPVGAGIFVLPLIGALDSARVNVVQERALSVGMRAGTRQIILDVSGLLIIDTQIARSMLDTVSALRLVGVKTTLAGLRPEVAQTLVSLGIDLRDIHTVADVENALKATMLIRQ